MMLQGGLGARVFKGHCNKTLELEELFLVKILGRKVGTLNEPSRDVYKLVLHYEASVQGYWNFSNIEYLQKLLSVVLHRSSANL